MIISDAESVVMEVLWESESLTADDIINALSGQQDWSAATIKTLLNRLLKKGAITAERDGRKYIYKADVTRTAYVDQQSQTLIDRLFDGRIAPLVSHFSERKGLTDSDIEELKKLIEGLDDGE